LGAKGVISVVSNLFPTETAAMTEAALAGDFDTAAAIQVQLQPVIDFLFCEPNPIPVKAAMHRLGYDCGGCRMPLTGLTVEHQTELNSFFP
jgi:4-hydroxy-tetrahydrodipicolinate synthase